MITSSKRWDLGCPKPTRQKRKKKRRKERPTKPFYGKTGQFLDPSSTAAPQIRAGPYYV